MYAHNTLVIQIQFSQVQLVHFLASISRNRSVALEAVEEHVEARADVHGGGARVGVVRVDDAECGLHRARGDAGFEGERGDVEDRGAGRFGASAGCRGYCKRSN